MSTPRQALAALIKNECGKAGDVVSALSKEELAAIIREAFVLGMREGAGEMEQAVYRCAAELEKEKP